MNHEAVAEADLFVFGQLEIAGAGGFLFEVVDTEGIGGEESVISDVPPGGVAWISGVVEDGDAHDLTIDGAVVIDPGCAFAPGIGVAHPFAGDDMSGGLSGVVAIRLQAHTFGEADGHGTFFGIAEGERAFAGEDADIEVKHADLRMTVDVEFVFGGGDWFAVLVHESVCAVQNADLRSGLQLLEGGMDGSAGILAFRPEVDAVDIAVSVPDGSVVWVVVFFVGTVLEGPAAADEHLAGAVDGEQAGARGVAVVIFGERLAIDLDEDLTGVWIVLESNAGSGLGSPDGGEGEEANG